ncbi:MAG: hypothetical protein KatS3mg118_0797 [Paracoccaceae bacterium]|nr:MAG: hypothetical protein KatS3mg118_0797 [Paracoccaceae bacterium]
MTTLAELRRGGKPALARALAAVEAGGAAALLDAALQDPRGIALGLTGPPGVGKSTLTGALIPRLRARGLSVAVIAVDPSSRRSGGALLGDRTRIRHDPEDAGVFIRSMAARDQLGGVAEATYPALVLMRATHDVVIVETVGVGQSETEIADLADRVVLLAEPGGGGCAAVHEGGGSSRRRIWFWSPRPTAARPRGPPRPRCAARWRCRRGARCRWPRSRRRPARGSRRSTRCSRPTPPWPGGGWSRPRPGCARASAPISGDSAWLRPGPRLVARPGAVFSGLASVARSLQTLLADWSARG